ncbi:N-acetylmuramoyl-L-alanine amidase family protein [Limnochorda pilosa]|uniref:N-acetylmuramoyl-L-alanine amidase n=1 Tax=Limnochorda pilosa TaxID=1555112 RepID=A0A0K2SPR7_LIMPI|nr:N-acetylmuramoyl-L-alanine amidase [Limnochorda pilosa]BAS29128.1 N-acetylmuramoyl-L-alanine amidase [Limnochorda pilosa]
MSRRPIWVISGWTLLALLGLLLAAGVALIYAGTLPGRPAPRPGDRVLVDPGHGGIDSGCHWDQLFEKDLTLRMAVLVKNRLEEAGVPAFLTRSSDRDLDPLEPSIRGRHQRDLQARAELARQVRPVAMVSLHVNAGTGERLSGAMVFYQAQSPESRRLAALILEELRNVVPGNQNGILSADFYLLRSVPHPTVLVEAGFLTTARDRATLTSPDGQERIAEAVATGILAYLRGQAAPIPSDRPSLAPALGGFGRDRLEPDTDGCGS